MKHCLTLNLETSLSGSRCILQFSTNLQVSFCVDTVVQYAWNFHIQAAPQSLQSWKMNHQQMGYLTHGFSVVCRHLSIMQCKKQPHMFHTFLLHPLAQTPSLKKYQETSSGTHETAHDQCTWSSAHSSKVTSAAGSDCADCSWWTH